MAPFMMGTTSSIAAQSLGKIAHCAPAVGAKMWCFLFVCLFVGTALSTEHRAFEGCIVRTRIASPFIGQFRRGLKRFFSEGIALSDTIHSSHIRR